MNGVAGPSIIPAPPVEAFPVPGPNMVEPKDEESDQLDDDELLCSDDDEDGPTAFKIYNPLPDFREYNRPLGEIHRAFSNNSTAAARQGVWKDQSGSLVFPVGMIHDGLIELCPDYQRDVVWAPPKQSQLIESIFRNYTIPQIVLSATTDESGAEIWNCVDGKQRLTSIQRFIDGLIPYVDPKTKTKWWYTTSETHKGQRNLMPQRWKVYFTARTITISEYQNIDSLQEREVFQRVQLGVALKSAEKLRAILTPRATWISRTEEKHVSYDDGLASKMNLNTKHARDFQNIAYMVYLCEGLPEQIEPTVSKLEKWLTSKEELTDTFKAQIETVLRDLWVLADNPLYNAPFKRIEAKVAPLEFVFIGVFLFLIRDEVDRKTQSTAIHKLRNTIREQHAGEIKMNTKTVKNVWLILREIQRSISRAPLPSTQSPRKRHQRQDDDDSDDDFRPNGRAKKGKTKRS